MRIGAANDMTYFPMDLTECRRFFERPATPSQRQYEALRAYFIEGLPSAEVARRFGYTPHAFRMLCYNFRRGEFDFFVVKRPGPRQQPRSDKVRNVVVELRKRNYSIYDISRELKEQGKSLGPTAVRQILAEEGFAALPRRLDEERPVGVGPNGNAERLGRFEVDDKLKFGGQLDGKVRRFRAP